ncbi:hypothetical protein IJF91_00215 [Candidatus Saccharibacteria bacterium]|nr:hypothetical protein [Candidatus Saccharibacteria bacterium]
MDKKLKITLTIIYQIILIFVAIMSKTLTTCSSGYEAYCRSFSPVVVAWVLLSGEGLFITTLLILSCKKKRSILKVVFSVIFGLITVFVFFVPIIWLVGITR